MNRQKFWKITFRSMVCLLAIIITLALAAGLYRNHKQSEISSATKIETKNGIDEMVALRIGESDQWFYMRGKNRDNPVLLFLHGGPGTPEMPFARMFGNRLEEHFVVVHWDQRASGKTRRENAQSDLSLEIYLKDTLDAIQVLRAKFNQEKIYLIGHSWGSVLGLLTARDHPDLLHAYIGMGQVVNIHENERISLNFTIEMASREHNEVALKELSSISPPYDQNPAELFMQRKWLYQYGGGFKNISFGKLFSELIYSPEYSLLDLYAFYKGMAEVPIIMWPHLKGIDFTAQATSIQIPVYFFTGKYDYNTPFELIENYYNVVKAPYKEIVWFENSAHFMNISDPEHFQNSLISKVLKWSSIEEKNNTQ